MNKIEDLLVNRGLYDHVEICEDDYGELEELNSATFLSLYKIDAHCVECGEKRTFESSDRNVRDESANIVMATGRYNVFEQAEKESIAYKYNELLNKRYTLSFRCTRNRSHAMQFDLLTTDTSILKIGQYPSYADLASVKMVKYKSVLKNDYVEFSKAIGLFSHGVGVGAFVYLRRIIESLVINKYYKNSKSVKISEDDFKSIKFKEKISAVSEFLPEILVENKNVYSILSKGVHELDEEECLKMFPYMQIAIELILDDILAEKEKMEKEKMLKTFVSNKMGELK